MSSNNDSSNNRIHVPEASDLSKARWPRSCVPCET